MRPTRRAPFADRGMHVDLHVTGGAAFTSFDSFWAKTTSAGGGGLPGSFSAASSPCLLGSPEQPRSRREPVAGGDAPRRGLAPASDGWGRATPQSGVVGATAARRSPAIKAQIRTALGGRAALRCASPHRAGEGSAPKRPRTRATAGTLRGDRRRADRREAPSDDCSRQHCRRMGRWHHLDTVFGCRIDSSTQSSACRPDQCGFASAVSRAAFGRAHAAQTALR